MSIEKMSLAEITGDISHLDEGQFRCLITGDFQMEDASRFANDSSGFAPIAEENPYQGLLSKSMAIAQRMGMMGEEETPQQRKENAKLIHRFLRTVTGGLGEIQPKSPLLAQEWQKVQAGSRSLSGADWGRMSLTHRLSTYRMGCWTGKIAQRYLAQVERWDPQLLHCQEIFRKGEDSWCLILGDQHRVEEVRRALLEVNFHEVIIGAPLQDRPAENGLPMAVNQRVEDLARRQRHLLRLIEENREKLEKLSGAAAGVGNIYAGHYLKIRFGSIPAESRQALEEQGDAPFLFTEICQEGRYIWGVYFTTEDHIRWADEFFASLGFERVWMPQLTGERTKYRIAAWDDYLTRLEQELAQLTNRRKGLVSQVEQLESTLVHLHHLEHLEVSLDDIFACRFFQVRFGRLPVDSYPKLEYYGEHLFVFDIFDQDSQYYWGAYFTPNGHEAEVDEIFASVFFERLKIPEFAHGTPENATRLLEKELAQRREELEHLEVQLEQYMNQNRERFYDTYAMSKHLSDSFDMRRFVGRSGDTFRILGFLPTRQVKHFRENLSAVEEVETQILPPDTDERLRIPTKLRNNRFVKPFEMFVEMYGMPAYHDIDPTPIVAVTYTLLFGIMFGDLGQGLVLALLGWFLSRRDGSDFGRILVRIGLSSAVFGFAYGSVFGLEHLLDPVFRWMGFAQKPIEVMDPGTINTLLVGAIGLGVALILVSMLTNILMGLKHRDYTSAIFGNNGIAGLIFYVAVLAGAVGLLVLEVNLFSPLYVLCLVALPILVIFLKEPLGKLAAGSKELKPEGGVASFLIEGFFELFEVLLSFVTNTMSFLRVGGFIISHAGMMAVVMTLTEMVGGGAGILVIVVGNLFVMALEGFIVGIQCLRLEFYEMFSRYFKGDGEPFVPLSPGKDDLGR